MDVKRQIALGLMVLVALCLAANNSYVTGQALEDSKETKPARPRFDELRSEGYDALYNLEYDRARQLFKEMVRLFPDHPAGPQSLAATLWLEELNRARHFEASTNSSDSFYSRSEKVDQRVVDQFRKWIREAKALAEASLRRDSNDLEALYFLGAANGLNAVFTAGVEQRYRAALGDSSRAIDRHKELIKRDPDLHDAELTIGLYNYVVGSLPLPIRVVASIGGVRGSKKRGLEMLERVARQGNWARDIARTLLVDVYKRERRWSDALSLSRELAKKYPRNYLFRLQTADLLIAQESKGQKKPPDLTARESTREALMIFDSMLHDRAARRAASDLIHFRYGEALLVAGEPERASEQFLAAARVANESSALGTLALLRGAQSLDLAGQRAKAMVEYRAVLQRPNVRRSHEDARQGLREPYRNR